jgi:hypothetical protein
MTTTRSLYQIVNQQFDKAADLINLDPDIRGILSRPTNEIVVHIIAPWALSKEVYAIIRPLTGTRSGLWLPG